MLRISNRTAALLTLLAGWAVLCDSSAPGKPPGGGTGGGSYSLVLIAPPGVALTTGQPTDVNEAGQIVGWYETPDKQQLAYYCAPAGNVFRTLLGGAYAAGLNNLGEIVGDDGSAPLYWADSSAAPLTLPGLPNESWALAVGINDAGLIVGRSGVDGVHHALVWDATTLGNPLVLPPLAGSLHAVPRMIGDVDEYGVAHVVGYCSTQNTHGDQDGRATLWDVWIDADGFLCSSEASDLGSGAGGPAIGIGVNTSGDACGKSDNWPFVKRNGALMQPLPAPRKAVAGWAADINDHGDVVGYLEVGSLMPRAYLWSAGKASDLNSKVPVGRNEALEFAKALNERGDIVGTGQFRQANAGYVLFVN